MQRRMTIAVVLTLWAGQLGAQTNLGLNSSNFTFYDAVYHNPAVIAAYSSAQASIGMQFPFIGLADDNLRTSLGSIALPFGNGLAFGARAVYFSADVMQQGSFSILIAKSLFDDRLRLGGNANFLTYGYDRDEFDLEDRDDPLLSNALSKSVPSFGIGAVLQATPKFAIGVSIDHLNRPDISLDDSGFKKPLLINFGASYFTPFMTTQVDVQMESSDLLIHAGLRRSLLQNRMSLFAGYGFSGSAQRDLLAELNFQLGNVGLSYHYLYPLTELNTISSGSHRLMVVFGSGGSVAAGAGPEIIIANPASDRIETSQESILVNGQIRYEEGITEVQLYLNGRKVAQDAQPNKPRTTDFRKAIQLKEGDNIIKLVAFAGSAKSSKTLHVSFLPAVPPPVIALISPKEAVVDTPIYRFRATVHDERGLKYVKIMANGEEVKNYSYAKRKTRDRIETDINLRIGENLIQIVVANDRVDSREDIIVQYRSKKAPVIVLLSPKERKIEVNNPIVQLKMRIENVSNPSDVFINVSHTRSPDVRGVIVEGKIDKGLLIDKNINLAPGYSSIEIVALNKFGRAQEKIDVFYNPIANLDYHHKWAVLIGIDKYVDPELDSLRAAVSDARGVEEILRDVYGFDHVITLYDQNATKSQIVAALSDALRDTHEDDAVVIFFAGHGLTETLPDQSKLGYIVPHDGKKGSYASNISMKTILETQRIVPARHILYIIDSCYSGLLLFTRGVNLPPADMNTYEHIRKLLSKKARNVITAGGSEEEAVDGLFTGWLLQGLQGDADDDQDGFITFSELSRYVRKNVSYKARELSAKPQNPQSGYLTSHEGEFIFKRPFPLSAGKN